MHELYETTHQQSTQPVRDSQGWNLDKIISNFSITIKNFLNSSYICWLPYYCVPQHSILWWLHQMEKFYTLLAICLGNSPVTGEFPTQWPVMRSFGVFFFICAWINGWVNNNEDGDLRRHHAHYDVIVMDICAHLHYFLWRQQAGCLPINWHLHR